jgi:aspartate aminotransferase
MLADRLQLIQPSPTLSLNQRAKQLESTGVSVVNLSLGEPDFDTPEWVLEGAIQSMRQGLTRYTDVSGMIQLRQAIQTKLKIDNQLSYQLPEIIVSTGGKQVLFNALMATINSGDEVIIPAPYWVSYVDMVALLGGKNVIIPCPFAQGYKMTPEQLEKSITSRTKWLILNSPSNPTGVVYTYDELKEFAKILKKHPQVWVLSDDIYEYLVDGETQFWNIPMVDSEFQSRTLIVNGVSKSHAMTGWRIGYGAGPQPLIQAMTMLQSQMTSNACSVAQGAALRALSVSHSSLSNWKGQFQKRRDFLMERFLKIPEFQVLKPRGAFYIYVNITRLIGKTTPDGSMIQTDQDFCEYLLNSVHVAVVLGSAFGGSPAFRISYAASLSQLTEAADRLQRAVLDLKTTQSASQPIS